MEQQGVTWLVQYLDDFLTLGQSDPSSRSCNMKIMSAVCEEVGLPIEPAKNSRSGNRNHALGDGTRFEQRDYQAS